VVRLHGASVQASGRQRAYMNKTKRPTQQGDVWSWVVIGLVFCAVTIALFGPFIWELTHSV